MKHMKLLSVEPFYNYSIVMRRTFYEKEMIIKLDMKLKLEDICKTTIMPSFYKKQ